MNNRARAGWIIGALLALAAGCGGGAETDTGTTTGSGGGGGAASCPQGQAPGADGACVPVGIQQCAELFRGDDNLCHPSIEKCPAGTIPRFDEGCVPAGIPDCAPEFLGENGLCRPSMALCPAGTFAAPQEGCVSIDGALGCGEGPWGNVEEAPGDKHVDGAAPASGDGSRAAPFVTIAEAMAAVDDGGRVVLAAGMYDEPVTITKDVELRGRCPSMVTVSGTQPDPNGFPVVALVEATRSAAIRGVRLTGPGIGVVAFYARLEIEEVHLQEVQLFGVVAVGAQSDVSISHTFIEDVQPGAGNAFGQGVNLVTGGHATITASAIVGSRGTGILLDAGKPTLSITGSLVAGTGFDSGPELGGNALAVAGGTATVDNCAFVGNRGPQMLVRGPATLQVTGTLFSAGPEVGPPQIPPEELPAGRGVDLGEGATASFLQCDIRSNYEAGVLVRDPGTDVTLDTCFVGDTESGYERLGAGIEVEFGGTVHAYRTAVVRNTEAGVSAVLEGSTVEGDGLLVEGTKPGKDGYFGYGLTAREHASMSIANSAIVSNHEMGGFFGGSLVTVALEASIVERTLPSAYDGSRGMGLVCHDGATLDLSSSAILHNRTAALAFTIANGHVTGSLLSDVPNGKFTLLNPDHTYEDVGDGLLALFGSDVQVENTRIVGCSRAGLLFGDSRGNVAGSTVTDNRFGLVLQGTDRPDLSDDNAIVGNAEKDTVVDGALPVPGAPSELPPTP